MTSEDRFKFSSSEKAKIKTKAVEGLDPKFDLLTISDSDDQLENTYRVTMRIKKAKMHLVHFDMDTPFMLMKPNENPDNAGKFLPGRTDMLENYMDVTLDMVKASVRFYKMYGKE